MNIEAGAVIVFVIAVAGVITWMAWVAKKLNMIENMVFENQKKARYICDGVDIAINKLNEVLERLDYLYDEEDEECRCHLSRLDICDDDEDLDIHMITKEEFYFDNEFDTAHLIYDEQAGVVYYDGMSDVVFNDYPVLIGDGLRYFGVNGKDPNVIYIRNHKLGCDFEVTRVYPKKEAADGN